MGTYDGMDIGNSQHVPYFDNSIDRLASLGHLHMALDFFQPSYIFEQLSSVVYPFLSITDMYDSGG